MLDLWLDALESESHYVSHLLPTLDWKGGLLGVRLRLQPVELKELYREFLESTERALKAKNDVKGADGEASDVTLWPTDLAHFLEKRLAAHFAIQSFILDPAKAKLPDKGIANCQVLPTDVPPLKGDPFSGLIQIDEIPAQRGFGDDSAAETGNVDGDRRPSARQSRKLASQFKDYFLKHLDPYDKPVAADILALKAIEDAQKAYDSRLEVSFSGPLGELQGIGYPGVTNPRVRIRTRLRPTDGLDHEAAVQYEVAALQGVAAALLPEDYNGLGYQNLISMVFKLMSFRDAWMRVAKANTAGEPGELELIPPLQIVLIEEPEAHLHAQVQQVFIRKAYEVLRKHSHLGDSKHYVTQLLVSTHSSHLAHEVDFSCLRYFKRLPAGYPDAAQPVANVPVSTVINLTEAFGENNDTSRFTKRYLRATHCDLFFADAAILVEGAAERILLPLFVRQHYSYLDHCYITWLEVGGSHAHRLQPLIARLGLCTLIVTDIDACDPAQHRKACRPILGKGLLSNNPTLRNWHPKQEAIDILLGLEAKAKVLDDGPLFSVRAAYQVAIQVQHKGIVSQVAPYTFEDSVVLENLSVVGAMVGGTLATKFAALVNEASSPNELAERIYEGISKGAKAEFALDLLELEGGPDALKCPAYVAEGLEWLQSRLKANDTDILGPVAQMAEVIHDAVPSATVAQAAAEESQILPQGSPT